MGLFLVFHLFHQTTKRRRNRRIGARSTESTSNPKGIIQKPRIGRKPISPPATSRTPKTTRRMRDAGTGMEMRPSETRYRRLGSGKAKNHHFLLHQIDIANAFVLR